MQVHGYAKLALDSLSSDEVAFLQSIPKAELHAHLNGSIPLPVLQSLAEEYLDSSAIPSGAVRSGLSKLQNGVVLDHIHDFFELFPAIYALTATPDALSLATREVLKSFLSEDSNGVPECAYLELRSGPKATQYMSREDYVRIVLDEIEKYPAEKAAFIVSLDRKLDDKAMKECIDAAIKFKREGRRIVGIDLCGDPLVSPV
jgi:adenosine deaminase